MRIFTDKPIFSDQIFMYTHSLMVVQNIVYYLKVIISVGATKSHIRSEWVAEGYSQLPPSPPHTRNQLLVYSIWSSVIHSSILSTLSKVKWTKLNMKYKKLTQKMGNDQSMVYFWHFQNLSCWLLATPILESKLFLKKYVIWLYWFYRSWQPNSIYEWANKFLNPYWQRPSITIDSLCHWWLKVHCFCMNIPVYTYNFGTVIITMNVLTGFNEMTFQNV